MDSLYKKVGEFGIFQRLMILAIGTCGSMVGFITYASVFTKAKPELFCYKISESNKSISNYEENYCEIFSEIQANKLNGTEPKYECSYDKTYYGVTLITELGLICEKTYLANLTQTIFMIGCFSTFFVGVFSDKYGRKRVLSVIGLLINLTLISCVIFNLEIFNISDSVKLTVYTVAQYFLGFTSYSVEIVVYVLFLELTTPKYHTITAILYLNSYVMGEFLVLIISYIFRDWHILYLFLTGYCFLAFLIIIFVLPESPRILVANSKYDEAAKELNKIAKCNRKKEGKNNVKITAEMIKEIVEEETALLDENKKNDEIEETEKNSSAWYYLTHPWVNLLRFSLMAYVWVAVSMVYFGVSLGITNVSSNLNPYVMFLLSSSAEIVGYTGGAMSAKFKRNPILRICLILAAVCCIMVAFIEVEDGNLLSFNAILLMTCVFIGKAMSSTAFQLLYVYTNQLYPTYVRNTLVGIIASAGRFGSIISPQINLLGVLVWSSFPYCIFSAASFLACICLFFIPEPVEDEVK